MRRSIYGWGALLLTVSCWLPAVPLAQADDMILARGWTHQNYGRLVLDTGSAELAGIKTVGDIMVITFKRPVTVDMGAAITYLQPYLNSATPSADHRQLTLHLKQAVNFRQFDDNGNMVVDLGVPDPAAAKAAQLAATGCPERQPQQAEGAAEPGRGQRIGAGLVQEEADGAQDDAAQYEGQRSAGDVGMDVCGLLAEGRNLRPRHLFMCVHAASVGLARWNEKRIMPHASIR